MSSITDLVNELQNLKLFNQVNSMLMDFSGKLKAS